MKREEVTRQTGETGENLYFKGGRD